jgi:hypothetical protein
MNSISSRYEDVIFANIDGIVDDNASGVSKWELWKRSFRRWVLKDRFNCERNISELGS